MSMTGRCLCGAVSYTAEGVSTGIHACHCGMCRRWSGGPAFSALVGQVHFEASEHIGRFQSSAWAERGFCTRCGTHLFYHLKDADRYVISTGTFDEQAPFHLAGEIYIDEKPALYEIAGEHRRLSGEEFMAEMLKLGL